MKIYTPLLILALIFAFNFFFLKFNFLLSNTGEKHQNFASKSSVPLTGGILILLSFVVIYRESLVLIYYYLLISIFLLGLFSDVKIITSAKIRLILQFIIILSYLFFSDLRLSATGVELLDNLNNNHFFNYLFISFCLTILINGNNFIDGLNGLCLGYYLLIIYFIYKSKISSSFFYDSSLLLIFIISLLILIIINFCSKVFLGDNGSYLLGALFGTNLIQIYNGNNAISAFYIILLLWYPCFELLFSMIRKFIFKISPMKPDNNHLHHLFFYFFLNKFKLRNLLANNLSSLIILTLNFILFYWASISIYNTKKLCALIILSLIIYSAIYYYFYNWKKKLSIKK